MAKKKKGAYGFDHLINIILAIIPLTSFIFGLITRLTRGKILGAVLNFFIFPLFWIVDIITVVLDNKLSLLA